MIGILIALAAAASWGAADFFGGFASRKLNEFQVLLLASPSSLILLLFLVVIWGERFPSVNNIIIAIIAGICGLLGLAALYKGLTLGNAALVSPVAGVIGAVIPTLVGLLVEGLPSFLKLTGFGFSIAGIWLVTRTKKRDGKINREGLRLALLAGIGFGGFLSLIAQLEGEQVICAVSCCQINFDHLGIWFFARCAKFLFQNYRPRRWPSGLAFWTSEAISCTCWLLNSQD